MRLAALAVLALLVAPARADLPPLDPAHKQEAARLVAEGSVRYAAGDYQVALDRYDRAYQVYPSPKLHYNRAIALEALQRATEAADEYDRFIAEAGDAPPDALVRANAALVALEARLGKLAVTANVPGVVMVDGRAVGTAPVGVHLAPGPHEVDVTAVGRKPWRETVTIQATVTTRKLAELAPLDLRVSPPPPAPAQPGPVTLDHGAEPRDDGHRSVVQRWWFWGAVGAAVVAGAAITYAATRSPSTPATELGTVKPDL